MSALDPGLLETTFAALRVGILTVDAKARVQLQNPEASRILGVSSPVTSGQVLADVLGHKHPVVALLMQALESGRDLTSNSCAIPPRMDGEPLIVDLSATPIGDGSLGAVLMLHDRTIGLELEALVDQRQRSELYATLAAGIAHEIRNPLGGIRGAAQLLESKLGEERLQRYPRLIREETDRIRRLLDEFAELTLGGDLHTRSLNLHEMLDQLLALQARSDTWRDIDLRREYDPSIPDLELDPDRITQVFLNLCRNAVQAMDGQGRLTLRTRCETIYQLGPADATGPRHWVRIEVEDTGPGIAEEDLPHVFTPFFTKRDGGTGLGLPIAQHWVVRHGGRVQVRHAHAGGTQVRVLLPLRDRFQTLVDRLFFRTAYDFRRIVETASERLASVAEKSPFSVSASPLRTFSNRSISLVSVRS